MDVKNSLGCVECATAWDVLQGSWRTDFICRVLIFCRLQAVSSQSEHNGVYPYARRRVSHSHWFVFTQHRPVSSHLWISQSNYSFPQFLHLTLICLFITQQRHLMCVRVQPSLNNTRLLCVYYIGVFFRIDLWFFFLLQWSNQIRFYWSHTRV